VIPDCHGGKNHIRKILKAIQSFYDPGRSIANVNFCHVKNLINKNLGIHFRHAIMRFLVFVIEVSDHISFDTVPNLPLSHTKAVCSSSSSESIIILADLF